MGLIKNSEFKKKAKEKIIEWCSSSTSHGLPNIARSDKFSVKVMWFIFVLISTGLCAFMVSRSVIDFASFDVVTKIRVYRDVPVAFPTITICNINPLTTNYSLDRLQTEYKKWYKSTISQTEDDSLIESYANVFQYESKRSGVTDEERKKYGPDMSEMIMNCIFATQSCTYLNLDGKKYWVDFEWVYTINYGNCYRFNSGFDTFGNKIDLKMVSKEGKFSELENDLFLMENEIIPNLNSNRGFRIFIENSTDLKTTFDSGIEIKSATLTEISLRKIETERLDPPYSTCQKVYPDYSIYETFRSNSVPYKQKDCFNLCIQMKIIEKCSCFSLIYDTIGPSEYNQIEPCDFTSKCMNDFCTPFSIYSLPNTLSRSCENEEANKYCSDLCKIECISRGYEINSAFSDFPSERNLNTFKNSSQLKALQNDNTNLTDEQFKSKLAKVKIVFNDLSYTKISEIKKIGFVDMAASVGKYTFFSFNNLEIIQFIVL
jgi:hypothetical protein